MTEPLKNRTIVYFGPEPWSGLWRNRHQLMSRLASTNHVWYVEPPAILRHLFLGKKHRSRLFTRDASGVNIFHSPWWLPIVGRSPFKKPSIRLYLFVLGLVAKLRDVKPIVWFSKPEMLDYMVALESSLSIYHVVDEYSGYGKPSDSTCRKIAALENEILQKADIAVTVTSTLLADKSRYNANTYLVPNAVDFSAYADCPQGRPDDMAHITGPIIGYSGLFSPRLDLALLRASASRRPKWNFVFVGAVNERHCEEEVKSIRALDNVHFLGQKSVYDTPRYVNQFDVCLIPYVLDLRAEHASPLKLYEYAAASKPIVATNFAAARDFEGHIELVSDADSLISACESCLDTAAMSANVANNLRFAADNTWDHRIAQVSEIIRSHS